METRITYNDQVLIITGDIIRSEPSNNINEGFEAYDIKDDLLFDIWDDFDEDDLQEIEALCLIKAKENSQTNWEIANV